MHKWFIVSVVLLSAACARKEPEINFQASEAIKYFNTIDSICNKDNGKLWGVNFSGPVMFVDRPSRRIFASRPDREGLLRIKDGVWQGIFPRERIIENGPVEYGGEYYAMIPLPRQEDRYRIITMAVSALYRIYLKSNGFEPERFFIHYWDERPSRVWLKLEYRALKKALQSDREDLPGYLRDAIIFRSARREQIRSSQADENRFEKYNGLSLFTSVILCNETEEKANTRMIENIDFFYSLPSFSRSAGTILGSVYAFLLYRNGFDIKGISLNGGSIDSLAVSYFGLELPEISRDVAGSLAIVYDVDAIYKEEEQRMTGIRERVRRQLSKFTEKPVLTLELESPNFDFEPEDVRPLDTLGTIYNTLRVSDNWGKLTVEKGGCLLTDNLKTIRLGAKNIKESKNHINGDGWQLILNGNWKVVKQDDNYSLRKTSF